MREETPISTQKIWIHIKKFWWVCLLTTAAAVAMVAFTTWREYRFDKASALRDTYQANSMIYFPTENEDQARTLMTVLNSEQVVSRLNAALAERGLQEFDSGQDKLSIEWKGNCFPITVLAEGEERARLLSEAATESLLQWAEEHLGKTGQIVNHTELFTALERSSGEVEIYLLGTPRNVKLGIGSFLGWKKLMVICAGVFCGAALIFVLLIFDTKLRSKKEVANICDYPCLGSIRKSSQQDTEAVAAVLRRVMPEEAALYVSCSSNDTVRKVAEKSENRCHVKAEGWEKDRLEVLKEKEAYGGAVVFVRLNYDTVDQLECVLEDLENLKIKISGYVVTEG